MPSSPRSTDIFWLRAFTRITFPSPRGVLTRLPCLGKFFLASLYCSFSCIRQHRSRPHIPVISEGARDIPCSLAILIEIGMNSVMNSVQQRTSRPQAPIPPMILAESRGPIRRSSRLASGFSFLSFFNRFPRLGSSLPS